MLNRTTTNIKMGSNTQNVQFNATSTGMMQRSHPKSIFIRCAMGSEVEKNLFPENGDDSKILVKTEIKYNSSRQGRDYYDSGTKEEIFEEVQVLQTLIFGNNIFMVEVVKVKDLIVEEK